MCILSYMVMQVRDMSEKKEPGWRPSFRTPKCPHCASLAAAPKRTDSVSQATNPAPSEQENGFRRSRSTVANKPRRCELKMSLGFGSSVHPHSHPCLAITFPFFKLPLRSCLLCHVFSDPHLPSPSWERGALPPLARPVRDPPLSSCFPMLKGMGL